LANGSDPIVTDSGDVEEETGKKRTRELEQAMSKVTIE
jgi:hypothetical protein